MFATPISTEKPAFFSASTMISVVLLPVNLIASVFGMNAPIMPFINRADGFWIILGLMAVVIVTFIIFFKKKDWL